MLEQVKKYRSNHSLMLIKSLGNKTGFKHLALPFESFLVLQIIYNRFTIIQKIYNVLHVIIMHIGSSYIIVEQ